MDQSQNQSQDQNQSLRRQLPGSVRQVPSARSFVPATDAWHLATIVLLVAALSLTVAVIGDSILPGDLRLTRWVQAIDVPGAGALARFGNLVGSVPSSMTIAIAVTLLLWRTGHNAPALLIAATMLLRGLNPLLKALIDSPRPPADLVRITDDAGSSGFPSGHAMGVAILYGAITYLAPRVISSRRRRLLVQAAALFVILTTGFARIYSGVHWPSQVLGGYLWGTFFLLLLLWSFHIWRHGRQPERR